MYDSFLDELKKNLNLLESREVKCKIKKKNGFEIVRLNKDFLVIKRPSKKNVKVTLQVGFPFALCQEKIKMKSKDDITFCFWGEKLRKFQRKMMADRLKSKIIKVDKNSFRKRVASTMKKNPELNFISPYTYKGDTYISEYFPVEFEKKFKQKVKHR